MVETAVAATEALDKALADLEGALRRLDESHGRLLGLLEQKREAVARADIAAMTACCTREQECLARIAALERSREDAARAVAEALGEGQPPTIREIARRLPGERSERMVAIAANVREKVDRLRSRSAVLRQAADALSKHVAGVLQTFQSALGQTRIYERGGRIAAGAPIVRTVDLTS